MWKCQVKAKNGHFFLGNTNSGDQNILKALIYHRETSYYMVLKLISVNPFAPFAPFAPILSNMPVKINSAKYELLIGEEIYLRKIRGLEYFILHIVNVIDNFKVVQKFYDIRPISRVLSSY